MSDLVPDLPSGDPPTSAYQGPERRKADRRAPVDRRSGLDRRRGPGRRRSDLRRQAEEGDMPDELLEFVLAIDEYKRLNNRPFPSWSEVFELILYLGYRKVAPRAEHLNRVKLSQQPGGPSTPPSDTQGPHGPSKA